MIRSQFTQAKIHSRQNYPLSEHKQQNIVFLNIKLLFLIYCSRPVCNKNGRSCDDEEVHTWAVLPPTRSPLTLKSYHRHRHFLASSSSSSSLHAHIHTHTHMQLLIILVCVTARASNYTLITNRSLSIKFLIKKRGISLAISGRIWRPSSAAFPRLTSQARSPLHMANNRPKAALPSAVECNNYTREWAYSTASGFPKPPAVSKWCLFLVRARIIKHLTFRKPCLNVRGWK